MNANIILQSYYNFDIFNFLNLKSINKIFYWPRRGRPVLAKIGSARWLKALQCSDDNRRLLQETIRDWLARYNSCGPWATTWSRSIYPAGWSSSYRGWAFGWIGARRPLESRWVLPLYWPWLRSCRPPMLHCRRYLTSSPSTSTWARVSSWCSLRYWVSGAINIVHDWCCVIISD